MERLPGGRRVTITTDTLAAALEAHTQDDHEENGKACTTCIRYATAILFGPDYPQNTTEST